VASITQTKLLTLADLENTPERDGFRYELRNGEIIEMPPPKPRHWSLQQKLADLLKRSVGEKGVVGTELGFALSPANYRITDVVFISKDRWIAADQNEDFQGAPDLAIEVLSPSNTALEMNEKRQLCLQHGSREFWMVDPNARQVEVFTADGRWTVFNTGDKIPLFFAPEAPLSVDAVFED